MCHFGQRSDIVIELLFGTILSYRTLSRHCAFRLRCAESFILPLVFYHCGLVISIFELARCGSTTGGSTVIDGCIKYPPVSRTWLQEAVFRRLRCAGIVVSQSLALVTFASLMRMADAYRSMTVRW